MLRALELADPSMEIPLGDEGDPVWAAAELLCGRVGIAFAEFREQTIEFHMSYDGFSSSEKDDCSKNLLRFYHGRASRGGFAQYAAVAAYAAAVFTFPITTVFVECLFSGMNLNKSTMRSSMLDDTCVAVLKARELIQVFGGEYNGSMEPLPTLDFAKALDHNLK
eukprot:m.411698 g.411698  ORF g.411698 m.411698 type:complete len:165 (-) comp16816_c0_seq42:1844-2338(-)